MMQQNASNMAPHFCLIACLSSLNSFYFIASHSDERKAMMKRAYDSTGRTSVLGCCCRHDELTISLTYLRAAAISEESTEWEGGSAKMPPLHMSL